ncbi:MULTISPECIES: phosphoribosylanthranilate isomerase [Metabacillus]|uniref:phosphoribosylanthranilate isomerase n=1 Tax=Metabacillus TaxID=2675233 RepID=UPI000EF56AB5|nr:MULTISPECIES: phosphoribosylanthranilate isomerase [Metabacillus]UGB29259.1 phosphoribosylanthranilate isomerase [Metabacillus sp. B2-18]
MSKIALKFCGVQSLEDLQVVSDSIAQYIGFIFAESKRKVNPHLVGQWLKEVNTKKKVAAVFVNPTVEEVHSVLKHVPVDVIQFHGNETIEQINQVREIYPGFIWKALHHHDHTLEEMKKYVELVDGFVVDSRTKGQWGGTGVSFDWDAVPVYLEFAAKYNKICFIAGGVNEENISNLLNYHPQAIDLSSGIEVDRKKSKEKIRLIEERVLQHEHIS